MLASEIHNTHEVSGNGLKSDSPRPITEVGLLIRDPVLRRLVSDAVTQLQVRYIVLDEREADAADLVQLELIVTELLFAPSFLLSLERRTILYGGVPPSVIVVHHPGTRETSSIPIADDVSDDAATADPGFDTRFVPLDISLEPGRMAGNLRQVLCCHRAFSRLYRPAMDELSLNRRIFQSVNSGISVSDARLQDMPLIYVNPAFERITGYTFDEVIGKNCRMLNRAERSQEGLSSIRTALQTGTQVTSVLRNFRKDGTPFWNELLLSPVRDREGELTHFVGIQNDVTARVELESALRQSEKLAAVGRLASSIAHEINNPLESVMNLLYLAQNTLDPAEIKNFLRMADREMRRVALITSESLRFSKQSTRPQAVRPMELVESILHLYDAQLQNAEVTVEQKESMHRGERIGPLVTCFESEIRQVFSNLIRNAVDAMRSRTPALAWMATA